MPRVVPSQVAALIAASFPDSLSKPTAADGISNDQAPILKTIVRLCSDIPDDLIVLSGPDHADFVRALSTIEVAMQEWLYRGPISTLPKPRGGQKNTLAQLHSLLVKCPDEAPLATTSLLDFVIDGDLRNSIRLDIAASERDLVNGSFKAATVLAASAIEALLLWAIQNKATDRTGTSRTPPSDLPAAGQAAFAKKTLGKLPSNDPEWWVLSEYIEVALELNLISTETAIQCRLAKNFRNLIHPGRALRVGMICDRGTAHGAFAGVLAAVRDLSQ